MKIRYGFKELSGKPDNFTTNDSITQVFKIGSVISPSGLATLKNGWNYKQNDKYNQNLKFCLTKSAGENEFIIPLYIDNHDNKEKINFRIEIGYFENPDDWTGSYDDWVKKNEYNSVSVNLKTNCYYEFKVTVELSADEVIPPLEDRKPLNFTLEVIANKLFNGSILNNPLKRKVKIYLSNVVSPIKNYVFEIDGKPWSNKRLLLGETVWMKPLTLRGRCTPNTGIYLQTDIMLVQNHLGPFTVTEDNQIIKLTVQP